MAKTPTTALKPNGPLIPRPTDPRAELFYLIGRIANIEEGKRICELVIQLTAQASDDGTN